MGYTEGCVMISMFCASGTTVCNCVVKRVFYQDTEVMGMFEKYIHSHNLPVLVLTYLNLRVILNIALWTWWFV